MKKIIQILLIFLSCIVVICIGMKSFPIITIDFSQFDEANWEKYPNERYKMITSFEQKYPIGELSKEKILELLGNKSMSNSGNMFSYTIGGSLMFTKYYGLSFDSQGKCTERFIYDD